MADFFNTGVPELAAFIPTHRAIGPAATASGGILGNQTIPIMYADVTIEEEHRDELVITEHPVEQGAAITDHAYWKPSQVVIRAAWSPSSGRAQTTSYAADIRAQLKALQRSRLPFDLYTGKEAYSQMLIETLTTTTDGTSEYALMATLVCRQVILVRTKTVRVSSEAKSPQLKPTSEQGGKVAAPAAGWNPGNLAVQDPTTGDALVDANALASGTAPL